MFTVTIEPDSCTVKGYVKGNSLVSICQMGQYLPVQKPRLIQGEIKRKTEDTTSYIVFRAVTFVINTFQPFLGFSLYSQDN